MRAGARLNSSFPKHLNLPLRRFLNQGLNAAQEVTYTIQSEFVKNLTSVPFVTDNSGVLQDRQMLRYRGDVSADHIR